MAQRRASLLSMWIVLNHIFDLAKSREGNIACLLEYQLGHSIPSLVGSIHNAPEFSYLMVPTLYECVNQRGHGWWRDRREASPPFR